MMQVFGSVLMRIIFDAVSGSRLEIFDSNMMRDGAAGTLAQRGDELQKAKNVRLGWAGKNAEAQRRGAVNVVSEFLCASAPLR